MPDLSYSIQNIDTFICKITYLHCKINTFIVKYRYRYKSIHYIYATCVNISYALYDNTKKKVSSQSHYDYDYTFP